MSILSAAQITDWLNDSNAIRGTLIEVDVRLADTTVDITRYLSTISYQTNGTDVPSNTSYEPIVNTGIRFTEKLDINLGNSSLSVGDIELVNSDGSIDSWLLDTWKNRPVRAYLGDPRWPRDSFFLIFDGIVEDIDSKALGTINLKIRDKLQRLNTPVSEIKYADVAPYPDSTNVTPYVTDPTDPLNKVPDVFLPIVFGEVHNITPVIIDPGNLVYLCSYGQVRGLIEVRDNGVPLPSSSFIEDVSKGTFKMKFQPEGVLTASIKGDSLPQTWDSFVSGINYRQTIGSIVRRIVTGYGKTVPNATTGAPTTTPSTDRFNDSIDIDQAKFNAFEIANPQPVGIYCSSRENLLTVCQSLASSIGAQISLSRLGKLSIVQLNSPPIGTPFVISPDNIIEKSLQIVSKTDIQGSVNIGFTKNWTVQNSLVTNIPYEHKKLFAEEYSTIIKADADTINKYKLSTFPAQQNTLLITQKDAFAEATRRLNIFKTVHTVYRFTGFSTLLDLKLGDTIQLVNTRFGLTGAVGVGLGTVTSLQPDWETAKVIVEVFI